MKQIGDSMYNLIQNDCDLLCGVPMGALPICSYLSTKYDIPMIMIRDVVKDHSTCNTIEGSFNKKINVLLLKMLLLRGFC